MGCISILSVLLVGILNNNSFVLLTSVVAPEGSPAQIACIGNEDISIVYAVYHVPGICQGLDVTHEVKKLCVSPSTCAIWANISYLGSDPCPGQSKSLKIDYRCVKMLTVNSRKEIYPTMTCPEKTVISIVYASYHAPGICKGKDVSKIVKRECVSASKCTVRIQDADFGDPCRGRNMSLDIGYKCTTLQTLVIREGSNMELSCAGEESISIMFAHFASSDSQCEGRDVTEIIEKRCLGNTNCPIKVTSDEFGVDPCPTVTKTLEINYQCVCAGFRYGPGCIYECSEHCAGGGTCDSFSGACSESCKPGYTGERCVESCESRTYGRHCKYSCSENCAGPDNSCDNTNGTCLFGCAEGYQGQTCDIVGNQERSFYSAFVAFGSSGAGALVIFILIAVFLLDCGTPDSKVVKKQTDVKRVPSSKTPERREGTRSSALMSGYQWVKSIIENLDSPDASSSGTHYSEENMRASEFSLTAGTPV